MFYLFKLLDVALSFFIFKPQLCKAHTSEYVFSDTDPKSNVNTKVARNIACDIQHKHKNINHTLI